MTNEEILNKAWYSEKRKKDGVLISFRIGDLDNYIEFKDNTIIYSGGEIHCSNFKNL